MSFFSLRRTAIAEMELRFQRRSVASARRWNGWVRRAVYLFALLVALILYLGELAGSVLQRDPAPLARMLGPIPMLLVIITFISHGSLLIGLLDAAANSITREREHGRWEALAMTGISARRLVVGKWWGTLRRVERDLLLLVPLRVGVVAFFGAVVSRSFYPFSASSFPALTIPPDPLAILMVIPILLAFTCLGAALAAAIGVAASAIFRRRVAAVVGSAVLAFVLIVTVAGILGSGHLVLSAPYTGDADAYERSTIVRSTLAAMFYSWLDNGTTLASSLLTYEIAYPADQNTTGPLPPPRTDDQRRQEALTFGLALGFSLALLVLLTWAALLIAERLLQRGGVLRGNTG